MSATMTANNGHQQAPGEVRTYRARRLEELIPKIRSELGPDAIILRQREGLMGGIGGFFAQRCVEVEAQAAPRLDVYDEDPTGGGGRLAGPFAAALAAAAGGFAEEGAGSERSAADIADAEGTSSEGSAANRADAEGTSSEGSAANRADAEGTSSEGSAADRPDAEGTSAEGSAAGGGRTDASSPPRAGGEGAALAGELVERGLSEDWACRLVARAEAHQAVFTASRRQAVRAALAASLPPVPALPEAGARVAFVGADLSGKTRLTAALAAAYRRSSSLAVRVLALGTAGSAQHMEELLRGRRELAELLAGRGIPVIAATAAGAVRTLHGAARRELVVIDAGPLSPENRGEVRARAAELTRLELDAVYLAVPATLRPETARRLVGRLRPLRPAGLAITHADRTDQLGMAVELAHAASLPIAYLHEGLELERALHQPDPAELALRLLP